MNIHVVFCCLLSFCNCIGTTSFAWCNKPVQVTRETINDMADIWQFTFLHKVSKNQLDEYVKLLMETNNKKPAYNEAIVRAIGALKTNDAFCFLYFCCMGRWIIKDIAPIDFQVGVVQQYGHKVLNKYFLDGKVNDSLPDRQFKEEVMRRCALKDPVCYYCPQFPAEITLEEMRKINTKKYDKQIIGIIKNNSDLTIYGEEPGRMLRAAGNIRQLTMQLDFVEDCYMDVCGPKIEIFPQPFAFGVIMTIDGKRVERCYHILAGRIERNNSNRGKPVYDYDHLHYESYEFCLGFVAKARALCKGSKETQGIKQAIH